MPRTIRVEVRSRWRKADKLGWAKAPVINSLDLTVAAGLWPDGWTSLNCIAKVHDRCSGEYSISPDTTLICICLECFHGREDKPLETDLERP